MNQDDVAPAAAHRAARWSEVRRAAFLAHLAETSNVSASAKIAGMTAASAYRERRNSDAFRAAWHAALCEGYARLEVELLADALRVASGKIHDTTLKSRAQKHRLGLTLLAAHRASVRGDPAPAAKRGATILSAREQLEARFAVMHDRLKDHG